MGKHVVAGMVGAALMLAGMSVMGASHQAASNAEVVKKLDQLRAVMVMSHHAEIREFLKPMAGKDKPDRDLMQAILPFYGSVEDLGKDEDGAALCYLLTGKTISQVKKDHGK